MNMKVLGAASLAALALVACAKKEAATAEPPAADAAVADTAAADVTDEAAEAADVYATPVVVDLATVRTKEALTAAVDTAFKQVDADADGALSQTEFYALAALMASAAPVEPVVEDVYETAAEAASDAAPAVSELAADAADAAENALPEEPTADSSSLDASFAAISGGDASLSSDDLRAALLARFDAADVNLDGALDDAESAAFAAQRLF